MIKEINLKYETSSVIIDQRSEGYINIEVSDHNHMVTLIFNEEEFDDLKNSISIMKIKKGAK